MSHYDNDIHHRTSTRLGEIVPQFIQAEYPQFFAFLKAYFEFIEQNDTNPIKSVYVTQPGVVTVLTGNSLVNGSNTSFTLVNRGSEANSSLQTYDRLKIGDDVFTVRNVVNNTSLFLFDVPQRNYYGNTYFVETEKSIRQASGALRQILTFHDIDETIPDFISYFQDTFLRDFPQQGVNLKLLVPKILNFYQARGSEESFRFLFRALFGKEISFRYPRDYTFNTSDAVFERPTVLKIDSTPPRTIYRATTASNAAIFLAGETVTATNATATLGYATVANTVNSTAVEMYAIYGSISTNPSYTVTLTGNTSGATRTLSANLVDSGKRTTGLTYGPLQTGNPYSLESREIVGLTSNVRARITQVREEVEGRNAILSLNLEDVVVNDIPFNILLNSDIDADNGNNLLFTTFGIPPQQVETKIYTSNFVQEQKPGTTFEPGERISTLPLEDPLRIEATITGSVKGFIVNSGGDGFKVGDLIYVPNSPPTINGYGAVGRVTALSTSEIAQVSIVSSGDGYYTGIPLAVDNAGTGGSGLEGFVSRITTGQLLLHADPTTLIVTQTSTNNFTVGETVTATSGGTATVHAVLNTTAFLVTAQTGTFAVNDILTGGTSAVQRTQSANGVPSTIADNDVLAFVIQDPVNAAKTLQYQSSREAINYYEEGISLLEILSWPIRVEDNASSLNTLVGDGLLSITTRESSNNFTVGELISTDGNGMGILLTTVNSTVLILEGTNGVFSSGATLTGNTSGQTRIQYGPTETVYLSFNPPKINDTVDYPGDWGMGVTTSGIYGYNLSSIIEPILLATSIIPFYINGIRVDVGEVSEIIINGIGRGYVLGSPTVTLPVPIQPETANGQVVSRNIVPYIPAELVATASNGIIGSVEAIIGGSGYSGAGTFVVNSSMTSSTTGTGAELQIVLGAQTEGTSRFKSTRSLASADQYMQDESTYQPFAYVLSVEEDLTNYQDVVKRFVHPAGAKLIPNRSITTEINAGLTAFELLRTADAFIDVDPTTFTLLVSTPQIYRQIVDITSITGFAPEAQQFYQQQNVVNVTITASNIQQGFAQQNTSSITVSAPTIQQAYAQLGTGGVVVANVSTPVMHLIILVQTNELHTYLAPEVSVYASIGLSALTNQTTATAAGITQVYRQQVSVNIATTAPSEGVLVHRAFGVNNNPALTQYGDDPITIHGDEVIGSTDDSKPRIVTIEAPNPASVVFSPPPGP